MDKDRFLETAPRYYALALVWFFMRRPLALAPLSAITGTYATSDEADPEEPRSLIEKVPLLDQAVQWLEQLGLLSVYPDDFAPTLFSRPSDFSENWDRLISQPDGELFSRFVRVWTSEAQVDEWLRSTLYKVNITYEQLKIQPSDFKQPDQVWAPIPVEHDQPEVQAVIEATDDAVEKIRSDNGYAATYPEERSYVVDGLQAFGRRLREAGTISLPYIKQYAIEPIARATKTLGRSVGGIAIEVLKARLKEWLMKQGVPWPFDWP